MTGTPRPMRPVPGGAFFATIGPLNAHPRPDVTTFKGRYFTSHWEMLDNTRKVVGRSESDSWGIEPTKYWLAP